MSELWLASPFSWEHDRYKDNSQKLYPPNPGGPPWLHMHAEDGYALIIRAEGGAVYSNQSGGMLCLHPEVTGFYLGQITDSGSAPSDCPLLCNGRSALEAGADGLTLCDEIDKWLEGLGHYQWKISIDRDRLGEMTEAWWPVKLEETSKNSLTNGVTRYGVLFGGNCD